MSYRETNRETGFKLLLESKTEDIEQVSTQKSTVDCATQKVNTPCQSMS